MSESDKNTAPTAPSDVAHREHDSDVRGEHKYPAKQQTEKEHLARRERDALKRRLER